MIKNTTQFREETDCPERRRVDSKPSFTRQQLSDDKTMTVTADRHRLSTKNSLSHSEKTSNSSCLQQRLSSKPITNLSSKNASSQKTTQESLFTNNPKPSAQNELSKRTVYVCLHRQTNNQVHLFNYKKTTFYPPEYNAVLTKTALYSGLNARRPASCAS